MYKELKARLKHVARLEAEDYGAAPEDHASHQAAEAIEQLERQLAERDAEIAKYRDALEYIARQRMDEGGCYYSNRDCIRTAKKALIVKPGEQ